MSRACLPSCSLAAVAPEGAGRLSCLYSANKEANCSHQGGPLGWGELLRTLFLKIASWGCLSAHQAVLRIPLPRRGPAGYQGDGPWASAGNASAPPHCWWAGDKMGFSVWKQNQGLGLNRANSPAWPSAERSRGFRCEGQRPGVAKSLVEWRRGWGEKVGGSVPATSPGCQGGRLRRAQLLTTILGYSEHPPHRHWLNTDSVQPSVDGGVPGWLVLTCQSWWLASGHPTGWLLSRHHQRWSYTLMRTCCIAQGTLSVLCGDLDGCWS